MDCGMPWRPPQIPAVTTCHVSAAYKSEHDGHTLARRFLQRANTVCCRPAPSTPTRWIGRAQNPAPATFDHQRSNPDHAARLTNWLTASGDGRPATTGHPSGADAQSLPEPACMTVTLTAGSDNPATKTSGPANHGDQHRSQRRGGSRPLGAPVRRPGPDQPYRHRAAQTMPATRVIDRLATVSRCCPGDTNRRAPVGADQLTNHRRQQPTQKTALTCGVRTFITYIKDYENKSLKDILDASPRRSPTVPGGVQRDLPAFPAPPPSAHRR